MGNVLQCCVRLTNLLWCKNIPEQTEERSPLLSRENSDVESLSPSRISPYALASPVLDQDHLRYPDIVLSSSHGREKFTHQLELVQAEWEPNYLSLEEPGGKEGGDGTSNVGICQQIQQSDAYQSCSVENEWPLLSSLHSQSTNGPSPSMIYTQGRGTGAFIHQGAQGGHQTVSTELQPAGVYNTTSTFKPGFEITLEKEAGVHKEHSKQDANNPEARIEQVELKPAQGHPNLTPPAGDASRSQWEKKCGPDEGEGDLPTVEEGRQKRKAFQNDPDQTQHREAQDGEIGAQPDEQEGDSQLERAEPENTKVTRAEEPKLELKDITGTEKVSEHCCSGPEVAPSEQIIMEQRSLLEGEEGRKLDDDDVQAPQHQDQEMQQDKSALLTEKDGEENRDSLIAKLPERFTLFVVDKLFLATPNITGLNPDVFSQQADVESGNEEEFWEDSALLDTDTSNNTSFTVKIQAPGSEATDFQVSPLAMVQEMKQVLMEREETCHRTCFSLQLDGQTLDSYTHLSSIGNLKEGSLIKVVEEPYTFREVSKHLGHIRELLKSLDVTDAYNGVEGSSLSFLRSITGDGEDSNKVKRKAEVLKQSSCCPPDYILPGSKECPLGPLHPQFGNLKPPECLKVLTFSSWNPPPGNRKMHGDLMYLNVVTVEDRHVSITASARGFYVNQSTMYTFNPKPANPTALSHSIVELLNQISPGFKKNFSTLLKKRASSHPFERIATPFQVFSWTAPELRHAMDCVRTENSGSLLPGYEEHVPGQLRDWNEELQSTRELPRKSLTDRLLRDRAIFKANSDFVAAATQGAIAVVDGNVMPINPSEEPRNQMFIWSSVFFSLGFDAREHYQEWGGEAAAHAASNVDLNGVRAYSAVDTQGLYVLGTVLVDYRGYRVTAQSIIPGILEREQGQSVIYGSTDYGKTVVSNEKYLKLLDKASKQLRVQRHQVLNKDDTPVELCSSVECKGIVGNDGRHYILDLLFTFPPDLNFLPGEGEELNVECQQLGFPRPHPHRLTCLRQELIEAFVKHRYDLFIKAASRGLTQEASPHTNHNLKATAEDSKHSSSTVSAPPPHFDLRFNPNVFSPGVRFPSECCKDIEEQKQLLKDAVAFLVSHQIPAFIMDCLEHATMPLDGTTVTEALHQHGINIRYLGTVLQCIEKHPQKLQLDHVYRIVLCELITRCTKHLFRAYILAVEPSALSSSVSHFLNCLLGSSPEAEAGQTLERMGSRRRSRRRRSRGSVGGAVSAWAGLTSNELWRSVRAEGLEYYHYQIPWESVEEAVDRWQLRNSILLRETCIKTGIQILLREYHFETKNRTIFSEDDILNIFPIIKHVNPKASDGLCLLRCGQAKVQQGCLKEGCDLIKQALGLFTNVYGALHRDVCTCLRLLGRIYYILGDYAEALSHQQRAVLISERVLGIDHPNTMQEYKHLGLYSFAVGQTDIALRLLYRARLLLLLLCGELHPEMALLDSKIGLMLHSVMECDFAVKFLENALALTSKYHGPASLKVAQSHHLLAKVYESKGEFRTALRHEKQRYTIYRSQVGEWHEKTRESSEYLTLLTNQAVMLQRTINIIYRNPSESSVAPLKLSAPSRLWIVEQLNLVTGIVLIPLSNKDLETLRRDAQKTAT